MRSKDKKNETTEKSFQPGELVGIRLYPNPLIVLTKPFSKSQLDSEEIDSQNEYRAFGYLNIEDFFREDLTIKRKISSGGDIQISSYVTLERKDDLNNPKPFAGIVLEAYSHENTKSYQTYCLTKFYKVLIEVYAKAFWFPEMDLHKF